MLSVRAARPALLDRGIGGRGTRSRRIDDVAAAAHGDARMRVMSSAEFLPTEATLIWSSNPSGTVDQGLLTASAFFCFSPPPLKFSFFLPLEEPLQVLMTALGHLVLAREASVERQRAADRGNRSAEPQDIEARSAPADMLPPIVASHSLPPR